VTSRERILAAFARRPVDHVPCAPFMNFQDWNQRVGRRWQYPFGPSLPETLDYMVRELGVDQVVSFGCGTCPEAGTASRVRMDRGLIRKEWTTPSGTISAAVRFDENWPHGFDIPFFSDYNPSHCVEPWLKTRADVECLRHLLRPPGTEEELSAIRFAHREARHWADTYSLALCFSFGLGLSGALQMFGPTEACTLAASDPDILDAYLDIDHRWNLAVYDIVLDLGVDIVRRNGFYESCDFYGPATLRTLLGRRLSEEIRLVHQGGAVIGYTLLTGVTPMCEHLASLDFDCIVCPDIFMKGMDGPAIAAALGGRKSFWTGPSDTLHMPWDRPEEVRKAVRRVFEVFGKTGLILTPCSSSKAVFPWRNVLAMVDEWKALRDQ